MERTEVNNKLESEAQKLYAATLAVFQFQVPIHMLQKLQCIQSNHLHNQDT